MDNIKQFELPTPFDVGPVNCYLFETEHLTLLDPGPASDDTYAALVDQLAATGHALGDIDRILVTHPHMDHYGLAGRIRTEAEVEVLAHADATEHLGRPIEYFEREQDFFAPFLQSMGVPDRTARVVTGIPEPYVEFQEPVDVDRELDDGDLVSDGIELEVIHTPGHAPGSVCFVDATDRVVFTGDHLLGHITPNPLLTIDPVNANERTRSLPAYLSSLRRLRSVDVDVGYAGHGETIQDVPSRIDETLDHHETRKEVIAGILDETGPTSAYEVMQEMFPDLPTTEVFAGMSEVIGHLDLLEDEDRVTITEEDGVQYYSLM